MFHVERAVFFRWLFVPLFPIIISSERRFGSSETLSMFQMAWQFFPLARFITRTAQNDAPSLIFIHIFFDCFKLDETTKQRSDETKNKLRPDSARSLMNGSCFIPGLRSSQTLATEGMDYELRSTQGPLQKLAHP